MLQKEVDRLTKVDEDVIKKHEVMVDEVEALGKQNRNHKEEIKDLAKKLKAAEKEVHNNLGLKYAHEQKKAQLQLDKEVVTLERVRETRRIAADNMDKQQDNKKELISVKKKAAIDVTIAREDVKAKKQRGRVDQSAERINTTAMLHIASNGRFPNPAQATAAAAAAAPPPAHAGNIAEVRLVVVDFQFCCCHF